MEIGPCHRMGGNQVMKHSVSHVVCSRTICSLSDLFKTVVPPMSFSEEVLFYFCPFLNLPCQGSLCFGQTGSFLQMSNYWYASLSTSLFFIAPVGATRVTVVSPSYRGELSRQHAVIEPNYSATAQQSVSVSLDSGICFRKQL